MAYKAFDDREQETTSTPPPQEAAQVRNTTRPHWDAQTPTSSAPEKKTAPPSAGKPKNFHAVHLDDDEYQDYLKHKQQRNASRTRVDEDIVPMSNVGGKLVPTGHTRPQTTMPVDIESSNLRVDSRGGAYRHREDMTSHRRIFGEGARVSDPATDRDKREFGNFLLRPLSSSDDDRAMAMRPRAANWGKDINLPAESIKKPPVKPRSSHDKR
jgi:hypothetical protein